MKLYLYTAVPLVLLGVVLLGGYFLMPALDSPQTRLDAAVQEKVELAQRMLNDYNADAPLIQRAFGSSTQPASIHEQWREYTRVDQKNPLAAAKVDKLLDADKAALSKVSKSIADLNGTETVGVSLPGPQETYKNLQDAVKQNNALLERALKVVREAINLSEGAGESEARGSANPVATRLEAILLYHQADLMRRAAAIKRLGADTNRRGFATLLAQADEIQDEIKAKQNLLAGGSVPGMAALPQVKLPPIAIPVPRAQAGEKPKAKKRPGTERWWFLDTFIERLPGSKTGEGKAASTEPETAPQDNEQANTNSTTNPEPVNGAKTEPTGQPETPVTPPEMVPSIADRIAALKIGRAQTTQAIEAGQAETTRLTKQRDELNNALATVRQEAKRLELEMMEAERTGVKGADPKTAEEFKQRYGKLSAAYRRSLQEIATLENGSVRNAKSATDEPEKILQARLVPVDASKPMEPERGLKTVSSDLAAAQDSLAKNKALLAEIDEQIAGLTANRGMLEAAIAKLQNERKQVLAEAAKLSTAAIDATADANRIEKQALDLIDGPGARAANQAESAANEYQRKFETFVRRENPVDTPDPKLNKMAGNQFTAGGATSVKADLDFLAARTYVQQASDLKLHEQMLREMAAAGLPATVGDKKSSEQDKPGEAAAEASATNADAAAKLIQADLVEAAKRGRQALTDYGKAADQLNKLWAVYANIAAVHMLMAQLPRVDGDTEDHLALAKQTLGRAIQGREKRPEYSTYKRILDDLKNVQAAAPQP